MEIGLKIREIADRKKVASKELGDKIGRKRQAIYDIYSGKVSVNIDLLEKIAAALDEPIINFFDGQVKPEIDRQGLKEVIKSILDEVLTKYYIHYTILEQLSKEIHDNALKQQGLVHLRVERADNEIILSKEYKELKNKIKNEELSKYANNILDGFFSNIGPLGDRIELKSIINKYFDDKGDGYLIHILK